jgi:hypothetical protein
MEKVESKTVCKNPGTPRFKIIHPDDNYDMIDTNLQTRFQSGAGLPLLST